MISVNLYLETIIRDKNIIKQFKQKSDAAKKTKASDDYIDCINYVISEVSLFDVNSVQIEQYLRSYLKLIEENLEQSA